MIFNDNQKQNCQGNKLISFIADIYLIKPPLKLSDNFTKNFLDL